MWRCEEAAALTQVVGEDTSYRDRRVCRHPAHWRCPALTSSQLAALTGATTSLAKLRRRLSPIYHELDSASSTTDPARHCRSAASVSVGRRALSGRSTTGITRCTTTTHHSDLLSTADRRVTSRYGRATDHSDHASTQWASGRPIDTGLAVSRRHRMKSRNLRPSCPARPSPARRGRSVQGPHPVRCVVMDMRRCRRRPWASWVPQWRVAGISCAGAAACMQISLARSAEAAAAGRRSLGCRSAPRTKHQLSNGDGRSVGRTDGRRPRQCFGGVNASAAATRHDTQSSRSLIRKLIDYLFVADLRPPPPTLASSYTPCCCCCGWCHAN